MLYENDFFLQQRAVIPYARDYTHGEQEPMHRHQCAQLVHILTGVVTVETRQGCWVAPPGRGVWLPAKTDHQLTFTGAVAARTLFIDPLARADLPARCQVVQVSPLLRELINAALTITEAELAGTRAQRVIELILDEIRTLPMLPLHLPQPREPMMLELSRRIQRQPGALWELARTAVELNMSSRTLARRFQAETGLRFSDWVRRARLLAALDYLAQGKPVTQVALELGYDNPSAFSAMFRRTLGVAPSDYFGGQGGA